VKESYYVREEYKELVQEVLTGNGFGGTLHDD
jgi:hypothetical protein